MAALVATGVACGEGDRGPAGPEGPRGPEGPAGAQTIIMSQIGRYVPSPVVFDDGAAEIVAFDPSTDRTFVVNSAATTVDVLDLSNPASPSLVDTIDATALGEGANSVDVFGGVLAVAIEVADPNDGSLNVDGVVAFYDTTTLNLLGQVDVGPLPDHVVFTPDGNTVVVANEGEPNDDVSVNPEGSISIIDVSGGFTSPTETKATFTDFNVGESREDEFPAGIRVLFRTKTVDGELDPLGTALFTRAEELEPEFITISDDSSTAYVTLQEHNAVAVVDIATSEVSSIIYLGEKDYDRPGNELDASNRDDRIRIRNWPVKGLFQPDAIASYSVGGKTYLITANEGDAVEYESEDDQGNEVVYTEETRIGDLILDTTVFPDAAELQDDANLGRLNTTVTLGDTDGDGDTDELFCYGGRSFTIWDGDTGRPVYDSGNQFELITALRYGEDGFNANNDENGFDSRSDDKGPEPEGVVVGTVGNRRYAFIGLERVGGIMVYDVTQPESSRFVQYLNNRDMLASDSELEAGTAGDLGPEGLEFVSADDSPNGQPLLIVGNEVTGTTTVYGIDVVR